ncbi:hypothetical protein [Agromyces sp. NPDC057865]|uniref:hypothetical protein n=1 Tax=Agromyces sp. NPDC057865 TaxID=3346267 RepID=UPI003672EDE9
MRMATNRRRTRRTQRWGDWLAERAKPYDTVLVLVHGMGAAYRSQILLEWAEPLLQRMDWLARDRVIGANGDHGVTIHNSDLVGDLPIITATVRFPGPESTPPKERSTIEHRVAIIEARWSESFVPMTRAQVFQWAIGFLWHAILRMLTQFWGTMVLVPWYTMTNHPRNIWQKWPKFAPIRIIAIVLVFTVDLARLLLAFTAFVVTSAVVIALGLIASVVLPLLSPLLLIPWFKNVAQKVIDGVVESIGDVAAWKERPVRATAMRLVVRSALEQAKRLVGDHGDVHVFAHSQGAAVATYALFEELTPSDYRVTRLTTVGAAVVLLGRDKWRGRPDVYTPVSNWLDKTQDAPVAWANHWGIWDPFSAGPIADTNYGARARWRNAYFPVPDDSMGPEEHAVHNTSQPFTDHSVYYKNIVQVVDPTARSLLGARFPASKPSVEYVENRLAVVDQKSNGVNMLAAVAMAATLPGLPLTASWLIWIYEGIAWLVGTLLGIIPGSTVTGESAKQHVQFLLADPSKQPDPMDGPQLLLSPWGWVLSSLLLLAFFIWINQFVSRFSQRSRVWKRCPKSPFAWLALWSIPRALFVTGAAWSLCATVIVWASSWQVQAVVWTCSGIALIAIFVFIEPLIAPAPMVVPARGPVGAESAPPVALRLKDVVSTAEFQSDLDDRKVFLAKDKAELRALKRKRGQWLSNIQQSRQLELRRMAAEAKTNRGSVEQVRSSS